jgi:hypothetical protein
MDKQTIQLRRSEQQFPLLPLYRLDYFESQKRTDTDCRPRFRFSSVSLTQIAWMRTGGVDSDLAMCTLIWNGLN